MGRVTQRVDPTELLGRLAPHARAAIAVERGGAVLAVPVVYRRCGEEHRVGAAPGALPEPAAFERAVLVLDDGASWFELRAVTLRGRLAPAAGEADAEDDLVWLAFTPAGAIAWDYGSLHEEPDA